MSIPSIYFVSYEIDNWLYSLEITIIPNYKRATEISFIPQIKA